MGVLLADTAARQEQVRTLHHQLTEERHATASLRRQCSSLEARVLSMQKRSHAKRSSVAAESKRSSTSTPMEAATPTDRLRGPGRRESAPAGRSSTSGSLANGARVRRKKSAKPGWRF